MIAAVFTAKGVVVLRTFKCIDARWVSQRQGFTLLELLIVVIIVGILASVAIPQLSDFVEKSRGAEAVSNLDAIRIGMLAYQLENAGANPGSIGDMDVTIGNTPDWTFATTGGVGTATKARNPNSGETFTMDVNGTFGGNWDFVPNN